MPGTMNEDDSETTAIYNDKVAIADETPINGSRGVNGQSDDSSEVGGQGDGGSTLKVKDNMEGFEIVTRGEEDKENVNGHNGTSANGTENGDSRDSSSVQMDVEEEEDPLKPEQASEDSNSSDKVMDAAESSVDRSVVQQKQSMDGSVREEGGEEEEEMDTRSENCDTQEQGDEHSASRDSASAADGKVDKEDEDTVQADEDKGTKTKSEDAQEDKGDEEEPSSAADNTQETDEAEESKGKDTGDKQNTDGEKTEKNKDSSSKDNSVVVVEDSPSKSQQTNVIVVKTAQKAKKPSKVDRVLENAKGQGSSGGAGGDNIRPFAKLLFDLGLDLCRQQVYKDLIKVQKKKENHNKLNDSEKVQLSKLKEAYDHLVDRNEPFLRDTKKCPVCPYKSDCVNPLELHKEYEHSGGCAICGFTSQNIYSFYFHMEAEHNRQGRVQPVMGMHTCPYCPYEHHSSKKNFMKHLSKCEAHFKLNRNLQPVPSDCDIPLKPPPVAPAPKGTSRTLAAAQAAHLAAQKKAAEIRPSVRAPTATTAPAGTRQVLIPPNIVQGAQGGIPPWMNVQDQSGPQLVQVGNQYFLVVQQNGQTFMTPVVAGTQSQAMAAVQQQQKATIAAKPTPATKPVPAQSQPSQASKEQAAQQGKYEICEICGGFVKDKESLRIHFFWAHKIEIHPSVMKENHPSLKCQHCTQSFWTYQGYKRHCLVAHPAAKDFTQLMTCYVCTKQVPDFITHMTSKHPQVVKHMLSQIRCVVCQDAFPSETALESHMLVDHKDIVTKYGSLSGSDKPAGTTKKPGPASSKGNPTPMNLYPNSSNLKTCSRCSFKFTTSLAYNAHFNKTHVNEEEPCVLCGETVTVGKPLITHMKSEHLKNLVIPLTRVENQKEEQKEDGEGDKPSSRKRKRSAEEVIVIDLDDRQKKSKHKKEDEEDVEDMEIIDADDDDDDDDGAKDKSVEKESSKEDESEAEVIDADEIVDLDKSDNSEKSKEEDEEEEKEEEGKRRTISEEIIEVDGEKIVVQKLDE